MSSAMDVDAVPEGSQPGAQSPSEASFPGKPDPAEFNQKVLRAIQEHRAMNPSDFDSPTALVLDDPSLLLRIIIKAHLGSCNMDDQASTTYLRERRAFLHRLTRAYTSHLFADLLDGLQLPPGVVGSAETSAQGIRPSGSSNSDDSGLQGAFEEPYLGNTAKLFIDTLNRERRSYPLLAVGQPYNWSIPVIQSSGMGKSRMVEEAANTVFTIPINIREKLSHGRQTYPPSDVELRQYLEARMVKSDEEQQAEYAILLRVLFDETRKLVKLHWPNLTGETLAKAYADYLKEGRTEGKVGKNRENFFKAVANEAEKRRGGPDKGKTLDDLEGPLRLSGQRLVNVVHPERPANTNACLIYFDEAHALVQPVKPPNEKSPYHNLGTVLAKLKRADMFFIFLSTNSQMKGLAPPPSSYPSGRGYDGSQLIPPFNELPFDLYETAVLDAAGPLTLENMCKTETMIGFGRALYVFLLVHERKRLMHPTRWIAQRQADPTEDIVMFALNKLCAGGVRERKEDSALAALGVRVGITFDRAPHASQIQSRLVETHMRVVYSISRHGGYMDTGSPSEPILAEAAGHYLVHSGHGGVAKIGPEVLSSACEKGFLARGERGELCGRLIVTAAHDIALEKYLGNADEHRPYYHRPIPVLDFLRALFSLAVHDQILGAKPITAKDESTTLSQAFSESFVFFSHFAIAEDSEMLSTFGLATALVRGMAIQAEDGQASIDAVIPVHMGSLTTPISLGTTSAINLQFKNRKKALDCHVNRLVTVPDITKPVISIIFELGDEGRESGTVEVVQKSHSVARLGEQQEHRDDRHYLIVAHGCSPAVFGAVLPGSEAQYKTLLGRGTPVADFPRKGNEANVDALLDMKPAFTAERQEKLYVERIK
ncbi:hypothetical protein FRC10_009554 [Ceratobasidium sp. 414]|nr:hypothetical protein FRC10_009554 [Ceratobasidium sp. 414]